MSADELRQVVDFLTAKPPPINPSVPHQRARFVKLARYLAGEAVVPVETVVVGSVPAAWITAPGAGTGRTILYLHGGGYSIGSIETHKLLCHDLSAAAGARVLALDYRLAPEHPFPAAVEDAVAAARWLMEDQRVSPSQLAIAGDSAGGGLALAALVALRDRGHELPGAAACLSPWVDLEAIGESMSAKAAEDPVVQRGPLLEQAGLYLAGADPRAPLAAPLYADLARLPPLLVQVGTAEILFDDATRISERAWAAGVDVTLRVWPGMIHAWHLFAPMLGEGRAAIVEAGGFLRDRLA